MRGSPMRLHLGRAMTAIAVVGVLLAVLRAAVVSHPHVRRCWELAAREERLGRAYHHAASQYKACDQALPASEYCYNACLAHVARQPIPSDEQRERAAEAHRRAAEDHQEAAELHAAMAYRYRRAAFRWSRPLPNIPTRGNTVEVFDRYGCDQF